MKCVLLAQNALKCVCWPASAHTSWESLQCLTKPCSQRVAKIRRRDKGDGNKDATSLSCEILKRDIVCDRFLTAPSCIQRRARGAKPGVPHKRRQRPQNTAAWTVTAVRSQNSPTLGWMSQSALKLEQLELSEH